MTSSATWPGSRAETLRAALFRLRQDLDDKRAPNGWPRGVVGAFDLSGCVEYGYPEIAGYWLRWASRRRGVSDHQGNQVIAWLEAHESASAGWSTRIATAGRLLDPCYWRARYLFDHCMLWDGVRRWAGMRGDRRAERLAGRVWSHLQKFTMRSEQGGSGLVAALGRPSARWSGSVGPFLLKVCGRVQGGDGPIASACHRALPELVRAALDRPHFASHPQLYAIEGLLALGLAAEARQALDALLAAHGGLTQVRESVGQGQRRCDVLAQALRAAILCLAVSDNVKPAASAALLLAQCIDVRGRVPFAIDCPRGAFPTWASLFAEQALSAWLGEPLTVQDIV